MASAVCRTRVLSSAVCFSKTVQQSKLSQIFSTSRAEGFYRSIWRGQVEQPKLSRDCMTWQGETSPSEAMVHGKEVALPAQTLPSEAMQAEEVEGPVSSTNGSENVAAKGGERRRYRIFGDRHKAYEETSRLLPGCWIVVRIDGRAFHRFVEVHGFTRPNDLAAIGLMDAVATAVVEEYADIIMAYGQSDEYSFVFHKDTDLFSRRTSKFESLIASLFTSHYVMKWPSFFDTPLKLAPTFDGRAVCYPSADLVRDYLTWRQIDCHTNCLFNTCYWSLVDRGGKTGRQAGKVLHKASKSFMNELLFSQFGINYNNMAPVLKRGTLLVRRRERVELRTKEATAYTPAGTPYFRTLNHVDVHHEDVAVGTFWNDYCAELVKDNAEPQ